uniref:Uncharacterized protein n=1 Tax=Mycena chlorophos TaxID=658473 RepID=A0ABQ0LPP9_MYCCL|nr:predicted protein [Mycena chlorophos]
MYLSRRALTLIAIGCGVVIVLGVGHSRWRPSFVSSRVSLSDFGLSWEGVSRAEWISSKYASAPSHERPWSSGEGFTTKQLLNGPPTQSFRDNLRPELRYISTWHGDGISNDVTSYINLLFLAKSTGRVAIMDAFYPNAQHVGRGYKVAPENFPFSEAFDMPRFTALTGIDAVDWTAVKNASNEWIDTLGCWNLDQLNINVPAPHAAPTTDQHRIDVSYTIPPNWVKLYSDPANQCTRLSSLELLAFPEMYQRAMQTQQPAKSRHLGVELPPDEQLMCFDWLFYAAQQAVFDMFYDYSGPWRQVGQYLHFNPKIERLAQEYTRKAFKLSASEDIPPFISIHIRHNDFDIWCNGLPQEKCFAPISQFAYRVKQMQKRLKEEKGISTTHVIVTSDEDSEDFWAEVASYGWSWPDHTNTKDEYGPFYPFLIDGAIQAMSHAIIGTDRSTVSGIAAKRIESWQGGFAYFVRWGRPGADDENDPEYQLRLHALEEHF